MFKSIAFSLFATLCLFFYAHADWKDWNLHGRLEIAPAIINLDILESGRTVETLHMYGVRGDAILAVYKGISLKGGFTLGRREGKLNSGFIGIGQYLPLYEGLSILPSVGVAFSELYTRIDFEELGLFHLKEKFRSTTPYLSLELAYDITKCLSVTLLYQYGWAHTHTTIKPLFSNKSHSCGPNYGISLDYKIKDHWYVSLGAGYNITLSKEKHGLRAKGAKLGIAYYF
jgi:hypothetical protein